MSVFDSIFAAFGVPALLHINGDEALIDYHPTVGTTIADVTAIKRNERWEKELTQRGERRVRLCEFSWPVEDIPDLQLNATIEESVTGQVWKVVRPIAISDTLAHVECVAVQAFERTRPELRRP